ncbi:MAG: hypothetical protein J4215_02795 [Candidatus Diapherotrites archaeon]|uniref:Uncharacterized protein n=1 Tax=Candidatus Iainarchaeum sp. TaxID=3101447 RepID=A0A8T4L4P6_9ARCH|nr:hypothetical protein [Candidatus Diapherotrites archaeon]
MRLMLQNDEGVLKVTRIHFTSERERKRTDRAPSYQQRPLKPILNTPDLNSRTVSRDTYTQYRGITERKGDLAFINSRLHPTGLKIEPDGKVTLNGKSIDPEKLPGIWSILEYFHATVPHNYFPASDKKNPKN